MRVAPLGGYFADDIDRAVAEAARSAEITHAHPEGVAGAIAIAVAAAWAWRLRSTMPPPDRAQFIDLVLPHVPNGAVQFRLRRARDLPAGVQLSHAAAILGNGSKISAQDTVPFCLWCAGESLASYEEALWLGVGGLGDVDTVGAIVGGVVVLYTGVASIPPDWLRCREPLPRWAFVP